MDDDKKDGKKGMEELHKNSSHILNGFEADIPDLPCGYKERMDKAVLEIRKNALIAFDIAEEFGLGRVEVDAGNLMVVIAYNTKAECCGSCEAFVNELGWCQQQDEATTCDDYCGKWIRGVTPNDLSGTNKGDLND